jgi:hypothetical protein
VEQAGRIPQISWRERNDIINRRLAHRVFEENPPRVLQRLLYERRSFHDEPIVA